jgi:hypothetical protein
MVRPDPVQIAWPPWAVVPAVVNQADPGEDSAVDQEAGSAADLADQEVVADSVAPVVGALECAVLADGDQGVRVDQVVPEDPNGLLVPEPEHSVTDGATLAASIWATPDSA